MSLPRPIDLHTPLSIRDAFAFPLQNRLARREVLIGAALLCIPVLGWILNMGHRIQFVHNMQHGLPPWPVWRNYGKLLKLGVVALLGMIEYNVPPFIAGYFAWRLASIPLAVAALLLALLATLAIPGYMTHYCKRFDAREVFNPLRALHRVYQGGAAYWRAWGIALAALLVSFSGLLCFGVGFLITSVWFWQVAGFSFATVFSNEFKLVEERDM